MDDPSALVDATPPGPTPAGWYPDVSDAHTLRWWDGSGWTPAVRPNVAAPVVETPVDIPEHVVALARVDPFFAFAPPVFVALFSLVGTLFFRLGWGATGLDAALALFFLFGGPLGTLLVIRGILLLTSSRFTLTNRRIVARYGLLSRRTRELLLSKVESIGVSQDVIARAVGYGTIVLRGTGGLVLPITGIRNALGFQGQIQRQVDGAVKRR